jgi:hypothetical protein
MDAAAMTASREPSGVRALVRLRRACLRLPAVTERVSHGAPSWFVRDKRMFVMFWQEGHHDVAVSQIWAAAAPGMQEALGEADPERFFRPPYVGLRGWIGVRLDGDVDWAEVERLCRDAYRAVAPVRLAASLPDDD